VPAKTAKLRSVAAQVHEIRRESPEARFRHKVECVGLLAEGWSYAAVAKASHHDPATLKRWWRKASTQGVRSLCEAPRSGRPSKLSSQVRAEVLAAIKREPMKIGLPGYEWTGPMLVTWIKVRFGVKISLRTAQNLLPKHGA
jgi:transposase